MPRFRHKPTIVEADQWFPGAEIPGVERRQVAVSASGRPTVAGVPTPEGVFRVLSSGDWIIQTGYPVPDVLPDVTFRQLYDPVDDEAK